MTRQIKAAEVREGMEVEWSKKGITYRMQCLYKVEFKNHFLAETAGYNFCAEDGGVQYVSADQTVTVLAEPQPPEPTAFGACVEAGGVWFVRLDVRDLSDPDFQPWQSESLIQCTWAEVCDQGHVTVINADPFASTGQREPRVWDRYADVPEMTPFRVSVFAPLYRKVGDRIECKPVSAWEPSVTDEYELNKYSPFTEVLDA